MVNVYGENGSVIARVKYISNLDYWDGHNWTSGSMGHHSGVAKLRDGRFVLIHGSDWESDRNSAEIITEKEALDVILRSGNTDLLDDKRFSELKRLESEMVQEEEAEA
jgi:hypothetical protein